MQQGIHIDRHLLEISYSIVLLHGQFKNTEKKKINAPSKSNILPQVSGGQREFTH